MTFSIFISLGVLKRIGFRAGKAGGYASGTLNLGLHLKIFDFLYGEIKSGVGAEREAWFLRAAERSFMPAQA